MEDWLQKEVRDPFPCDPQTFPMDVIVSVGGDGTLLRATQTAVKRGVPVLGINVGRIGFLVEIEPERLGEACIRLRAGDYTIDERMMLDVSLPGKRQRTALNDVVLSRGGNARLIAVKAQVGDEPIGRYIADGLIVSTPTGSTGYSLSAGGPIICPEVECILLSPICPHSLQHRPIVTDASQVVTLTLDCSPGQSAQLDVDGQRVDTLTGKQQVTIRRSAQVTRLIRFGSNSFFHRIRTKLTEWSC
jgi:NAD+ kinase